MAAGGGKEMEIAIKIAGKMESSFNNAMSNAVKKLLKLELGIKAAVAAAGAIKDIGAAAIKTGADFEKSMSGLAATAGIDAGSEQYQRLENAAREMGRATSKSAAESADALQYMALAGWSVEDSIKGLPSILHLSEASGMELARTSDMVTDTMSALGISINELPGYLDVVAKAQNTTNQSAEQLMEAYLGVGGTLKSLGVSTEESATALGVLANRGTKGSEAGTALNAIMVNLTTGAGQAGKAMEALGVSAFDSEGNFIGLKATLEKVNEATKGMTQEERNAALAAIGGKQHLDSLQKLMAGLNDTTADGTQEWAAITEGLKDAGGALEEMRNRKVDNLAGDIDVIKSAASDLGISIYKDINTPLRSAVQLGTDMITELNNAYGSGGMEGMVGAVGGCMAEVVNTIADYAPQVVSMGVDLLENFISGITDNSGALATAASEVITVFVEGLFTLVPQVILAGIDIITQLAASITSQLPALFSNGIEAITNFLNGIMQRLPGIVSIGIDIIKTFTDGIRNNLPQMIPTAMEALLFFSASIRENVGNIVDAGLEMIMALAQALIDNIPVFIQTVPTIITNICGIINDNAPKLLSTGIILIGKLASGLIQAIPTLIANIPQIIQAVVSVFTAFNWISLGSRIVTFIGNGLSTMLPNLLSKGTQLVNHVAQGIASGLPTIMQNGAQMISSLIQGIGTALPTILQSGLRIILSLLQGIVANLPTIIQGGIQIILSFASGLLSALPTVLSAIGQLILSIGDAILSTNWLDVGIQIIKGLIDGIVSTGKSLWNAIKSLFTGGEVDIPDTSSQSAAVVNSYASGINSNAGTVTAAANSMATNAFSSMETTGATTAGAQAGQAFSTGLTDSLAAAPINTGALTVDTSAFTTTMTTAGTQGATAIGTGMTGNSQAVTQAATTMGTDINTALDSGWQKANTNAQTAMQRLATTVTDAARSAASAVKAAFENMTITIPKPRIPVISVSTNSVSYGDGGSVSVPQFSVNWNALGGIIDQPTIFNTSAGMQGVGEAGPEAILPLDTLWAKMKEILNEAIAASGGASLIDAFIEKLKGIGTGGGGGQPELAGAGGPAIQYSPVYNLYGSAGKEEIAEADRMSQAEFNKLMKQYEKDQQRRKL